MTHTACRTSPPPIGDRWGFGQGYALAEDRACTLLDQIVSVRGERVRWFGPGDGEANLNSDFELSVPR